MCSEQHERPFQPQSTKGLFTHWLLAPLSPISPGCVGGWGGQQGRQTETNVVRSHFAIELRPLQIPSPPNNHGGRGNVGPLCFFLFFLPFEGHARHRPGSHSEPLPAQLQPPPFGLSQGFFPPLPPGLRSQFQPQAALSPWEEQLLGLNTGTLQKEEFTCTVFLFQKVVS